MTEDGRNRTPDTSAVLQSSTFKGWLSALRDAKARARILIRIERLAAGNPGDHKSVGDGIMELRMTFGPGYRVYYQKQGDTLVLLLAGGDKSSQQEDIRAAKGIATRRESSGGGDFQSF